MSADPHARVCTCGHTAHWHNAILDASELRINQSDVERQQGMGECEANKDCKCSRFEEDKTDSYESLRRELRLAIEERDQNAEIAEGLAERVRMELDDYPAYVSAMDGLVSS